MKAESPVHLQGCGQPRGEWAEGDLVVSVPTLRSRGGKGGRALPQREPLIGGGGGRVQQGSGPLPRVAPPARDSRTVTLGHPRTLSHW